MDNISDNITYSEATKSQTATRRGIENVPSPSSLTNMIITANNIFEPIRKHFDTPIAVTSFFRSPKLNEAIGGSKTSQHCTGEALDIDADVFGGCTNMQIFEYAKTNIVYDQLIFEYGNDNNPAWVHVSYKDTNNRMQVLRAKRVNGKTVYSRID